MALYRVTFETDIIVEANDEASAIKIGKCNLFEEARNELSKLSKIQIINSDSCLEQGEGYSLPWRDLSRSGEAELTVFQILKKSEIEPQTLLSKIDNLLFEENYESVTINPQDYQELFIKNSEKLRHRYEPETKLDMLKNGIFGYLQGPKFELAKIIKVSKSLAPGKILANKEFTC